MTMRSSAAVLYSSRPIATAFAVAVAIVTAAAEAEVEAVFAAAAAAAVTGLAVICVGRHVYS